jgi:NADPH:quinone reductase-like Zn-dependent oxidoreductase
MKALIRDRYGLSDVLEIREVERPLPQEDEVLIQVHAASINDWDWGLLQSPTLPFMRVPPKPILGSDVAGQIVAVGRTVRRYQVGDDVYGDLSRFVSGRWGSFAQHVYQPGRGMNLARRAMSA